MTDPLIIQKIKDATDIVEVIGQFLTLHKAGRSYVGVCPFHDDTHPSMRVDAVRQRYKCFVCGAGGDVFQFLQEHEHMTFAEALAWCGHRIGIEVERDDSPEQQEHSRQMDALRIALDAAANYYQAHLQDASAYMASRGQSADVLARYRVGYAPDGGAAGRDLQAAGYSAQVLQTAGITGDGRYGQYDRFRDRIMFPFLDLQGRVIGFSGRYVTPVKDAGKYVNTGDTPVFTKGNNLFGLYQAKQSIIHTDTVYVVEGQFDVLSMAAAGIPNVVAGSGTAMTASQVSLLARFAGTVVLMYDADQAGLKATIANCGQLLARGLDVRCVRLPDGRDPDEIAREKGGDMASWIASAIKPWEQYFLDVLDVRHLNTPDEKEAALVTISSIAAQVASNSKRQFYAITLAEAFKCPIDSVTAKFHATVRNRPDTPAGKPGVYGLDELADNCRDDQYCLLTPDLDEFLACDSMPALYVSGRLEPEHIQQLRKAHQLYQISSRSLVIEDSGRESDFMASMADCFRAGLQTIDVVAGESDDSLSGDCSSYSFLNAYLLRYNAFFRHNPPSDKTEYVKRCAQLISCAEDSVRIVNFAFYQAQLGLTKAQLTDILKPFLEQRKTRIVLASQRDDNDTDDDYDQLPQYVDDNEDYKKMFLQCHFFPKLNKAGEPVCYMFQSDKGSFQPVGDFFMTPLLHIQSDDADNNKRVIKINRRYYTQPLYIEVKSRALLKKSTIEEELILLEAVNFTNGEEKHWTRIKEWMSRNFVTCSEVLVYGNQQADGLSRREDQMFFAFANGIYHQVDGVWRFDEINEFGVVSHNGRNYYLPAFSNIHSGQQESATDKYEDISTLVYREIPAERQCSFAQWADLMDRVYKINDNGKWALLFAIMCAFRSNIHALDRLFTAPFFMGPMSSGKTQIAISIRSLFISPKVPIFNLNIGTDAAMSSKMSSFRDVPVVLDEYNNKDISDVKFQALKGIVYDGDGRQKRKANSSREIENDKVFAPVIICGQETPQRDDNALMSRVIICEVPKPTGPRTDAEVALFEQLKGIEENGLSNVLTDILKLRPVVMDHFRELKVQCYQELKQHITIHGEVDRLMKTVSLFLATCRLIQDYTDLQLPFTYDRFFDIALAKVMMQKDLITRTDKLAIFFRAMDAMIDQRQLIEGRDYAFGTPDVLTLRTAKGESQALAVPPGTNVLFLRVGKVYTKFANSNYNTDGTTQSTIEQNLRSHPAYLGPVRGWRFTYYEAVEQLRGGIQVKQDLPFPGPDAVTVDNTMIKRMEKRSEISYCIAFNYDIFLDTYDVDLRRSSTGDQPDTEQSAMQPLDF